MLELEKLLLTRQSYLKEIKHETSATVTNRKRLKMLKWELSNLENKIIRKLDES